MAKEYIEVGSIRKGEYGLYLKFHPCRNKGSDGVWREDTNGMKKLAEALNNSTSGLSLSIEKPDIEPTRLCELGYIDEDEKEKRIDAIPEWKKYTVKLVQKK